MTFLNKQSFATFQVYFYSLIFERLLTQLNRNLYKKPLCYLVLGEAFNAGFPLLCQHRERSLKQWVLHKLFSLVKRSETRLPSVSVFIYLVHRITNVKNQARKRNSGHKHFRPGIKIEPVC